MKPDFALVLSPDGIELLHRMQRGWTFLGSVVLEDSSLRRQLADLRQTAVDLSPRGLATKLILPDSQVLFTSIPSPGPRDSDRVAAVRSTLDGMTPYSLDELAFDWEAEGDVLHVAVVARETLEEAEAFADEHRFNPVSFVTRPKGGSFTGEPYFGETRLAATLNGKAGRVKRDMAPTIVTLRAPRVQATEVKPSQPTAAGVIAASEPDLRTAEELAVTDAPSTIEPTVPVSVDLRQTGEQQSDVKAQEPTELGERATSDTPADGLAPQADVAADATAEESETPTPAETGPDDVEAINAPPGDAEVPGEHSAPTSQPAFVARGSELSDLAEASVASGTSFTGTVIAPVLVETVAELSEAPQAPVPGFTTRRTVEPEVAAARSVEAVSEGHTSRVGPLSGADPASGRRTVMPSAEAQVSATDAPAAVPAAPRLGPGAGTPGPAASSSASTPPKLGAATPGVRRPIPPVSPTKIIGIRKAMAAQSARTGRNAKAGVTAGTPGKALQDEQNPASAGKQRGKPRYVGLMLTAGLLAVLGAVGIWSAVFGPEPDEPVALAVPEFPGPAELTAARPEATPGPTAELPADADSSPRGEATLPPNDPVLPTETADVPALEPIAPAETGALESEVEPPVPETEELAAVDTPDVSVDLEAVAIAALPPVETTPAAPLVETEVALPEDGDGAALATDGPSTMESATVAATTTNPEAPAARAVEPPLPAPLLVTTPPDALPTPEADAIEGIYLASRDPSVPLAAAPGLIIEGAVLDGGLPILTPPPQPGIVYDFDEVGLVRPTVEGAPTPSGTVVFLGRPPLVPPTRPDQQPEQTISPEADGSPEAAVSPPAAGLEPAPGTEPTALADDGPFALPGVPATRPRPRPSDLRGSLDSELVTPDEEAAAQVVDATRAALAPRARPESLAVPPDAQDVSSSEPAQETVAEIAAALEVLPEGTETTPADLAGEALALIDPAASPEPVEGAPSNEVEQPLALTPGPADPRPRLRPQRLVESLAAQEAARVAQAAAAAAAIAAASDLAVAASPEPRPRPAGFGERAARIARSSTAEADAVAAAAAAAAASVAAPEPAPRTARTPDPEAEADGEDDVEVASAPAASGNVQLPSRASVAAQATQENAIRLNEINLIGIFGAANDRRALVRLPTGRFVRVEVGARLDGGRVAAITDRELRYEKGGRTYTLRVAQRS